MVIGSSRKLKKTEAEIPQGLTNRDDRMVIGSSRKLKKKLKMKYLKVGDTFAAEVKLLQQLRYLLSACSSH